jgi:hypothetical protein
MGTPHSTATVSKGCRNHHDQRNDELNAAFTGVVKRCGTGATSSHVGEIATANCGKTT